MQDRTTKGRFRIVALEERIAPSCCGCGGGLPTITLPTVSLQATGSASVSSCGGVHAGLSASGSVGSLGAFSVTIDP